MAYQGPERRVMFNKDFYDKMMETHNDVKHLVRTVGHHINDDEVKFEQARKEREWLKRVAWLGCGIIITVNVILKLIR